MIWLLIWVKEETFSIAFGLFLIPVSNMAGNGCFRWWNISVVCMRLLYVTLILLPSSGSTLIPYILRSLVCGEEVSLHTDSAVAGCGNLCLRNLLHCDFPDCKAGVQRSSLHLWGTWAVSWCGDSCRQYSFCNACSVMAFSFPVFIVRGKTLQTTVTLESASQIQGVELKE